MVSKQALSVMVALAVVAAPLGAQAWDDPRVLAMVRQATDRRVQQLADSGLVGYQATAHGFLTFLAQLGEGFLELPRVVKADELALEVYWRAPNLSKQRIVGRRDTTLMPTDIQYHLDHLGIIQNNFPAIIRLGEGDEVRDVPHPLSLPGMAAYQFALTDSLRITIPGRVIDVYEVQVRPRDARVPAVVGAIYLDREDARVVRMAVSFTRASFLDKQLEDVSIVLENGLVGTRFWLPRRQEVEIRRTLPWLDYPVRGIIRGRWEIGNYSINAEFPHIRFLGPEIVSAPPAQLRDYAWSSPRLVDSLPEESRIPTPAEIRRVQESARTLIREQGLRRARGALAARGVSDIVRFDRTSGLSVGSGVSARLGRGWVVDARGRYGFADRRARAAISLGWQSAGGGSVRVFASDDVRDAGDAAERSLMMNSFAAQEFASDFTDYYAVSEAGLAGTLPWRSSRVLLTASWSEHRALALTATPFAGTFRPAFDAASRRMTNIVARIDVPTRALRGLEWRFQGSARASSEFLGKRVSCAPPAPGSCGNAYEAVRVSGVIEVEETAGPVRVASRTFGGLVNASSFLLSQDLFFLGGPVSAPGFAYHSLIGDRAVSQSLEARVPVPFPRVSLGRFGRSPARAQLVPHWTAVGIHRVSDATEIRRTSFPVPAIDPFRSTATGWYHSAGLSLLTAFDLLRLDVSRTLPTGRWMFSIDITRPFWSIM
jgi:hypothetical protein